MPITWKNIEAPSFRESQLGIAAAGDAFSNAISGLENIVTDAQTISDTNYAQAKDAATQQAEESLLKGTDTQAQLDAFDFNEFANAYGATPIDRAALYDIYQGRQEALNKEALDTLSLSSKKADLAAKQAELEGTKLSNQQAKELNRESNILKNVATFAQGLRKQNPNITEQEIIDQVEAKYFQGRDAFLFSKGKQVISDLTVADLGLTATQTAAYNQAETQNEALFQADKLVLDQALEATKKELPTLSEIDAQADIKLSTDPYETINAKTKDNSWFSEDVKTNRRILKDSIQEAQDEYKDRAMKQLTDKIYAEIRDTGAKDKEAQAIKDKYANQIKQISKYKLSNEAINLAMNQTAQDREEGEIFFDENFPQRLLEADTQIAQYKKNESLRIQAQKDYDNQLSELSKLKTERTAANKIVAKGL